MKKIKKSILFFWVGIIFFTPIIGLFPGSQGKTYAAPVDEDTPAVQLHSYLYARALIKCIQEFSWNAEIHEDDANKFEFGGGGNTYVGYLDGHDDGKANCEKDDWIKEAAQIWNFNGSSDGATLLCYAGYNRENADNSQSASACARGTGDLVMENDDENTAVKRFISNVTRVYYGKESTRLPGMSPAMEYWYYYNNFLYLCDPTESGTPYEDYGSGELANTGDLIYTLAPDGVTKVVYKMTDKNTGDRVTTRVNGDGISNNTDEVKLKCGDMAVKAREGGRAQAYAAAKGIEPGDDTGNAATGAVDSDTGVDVRCGGPLTWVLCPFLNMAETAMGWLENWVTGMLCVDETSIFGAGSSVCTDSPGEDNSAAFYDAWNAFRVLALAMIVIGGLIMVLSQALGFEIFDAYTIKKVLPRILVAGVIITLSWPLLEFVVTLSNALGVGVRGLIYAPFDKNGIDEVVLGGGSGAILTLAGAAAFKVMGLLAVLSFMLTGLLALFVAFFVLVIRNILVIFLIIVAPLAISMYVLPNTEKYWKLWWEWLFKALMAFPIITGMIAVGHVFAAITSQAGGNLSGIVAFVAYFAPYFLIPAAFRFAGGALATIGGFANDRSRGAFDRVSRFRKGQSEQRSAYYGQKYGDRARQFQAQRIRSLNDAASKRKGVSAWALRSASGVIAPLGGVEQHMSAINARTGKKLGDIIATGKDDEIRGLTVDRSMGWDRALAAGLAQEKTNADGSKTRQWKSLGGAWINETDVIKGQKEWGRDVGAQQAAVSYEMRKAMTDTEVQGVSDRYASLAKNQFNMTDEQATGAWIGAAFENQNQHLEYKNTDWSSGKLNVEKFSKEAYEKKGSYQLSQMSGHTIKQLEQAYNVASGKHASGMGPVDPSKVDVESQERIRAVSETFMHQLRGQGGSDEEAAALAAAARDAALTPDAATSGSGQRMVSSNGPGAVNEAVYRLARTTGVLTNAPDRVAGPSHAFDPDTPQSPGSKQS